MEPLENMCEGSEPLRRHQFKQRHPQGILDITRASSAGYQMYRSERLVADIRFRST